MIQAVSEHEKRIERNQALIIQYQAHFIGNLLPHLLAFRAGLAWPCQQGNHFILRNRRLACRGTYELSERTSAGFEELTRRLDRAKRIEHLHPRFVDAGIGDLPLPGENLPEPDIRLQNAQGIGSHKPVGNFIEAVGHRKKPSDRSVRQTWEFRKDEILIAISFKLIGQQTGCCRV